MTLWTLSAVWNPGSSTSVTSSLVHKLGLERFDVVFQHSEGRVWTKYVEKGMICTGYCRTLLTGDMDEGGLEKLEEPPNLVSMFSWKDYVVICIRPFKEVVDIFI